MKLQYLGDSKDSFKWDYHDYLLNSLEYSTLNILPMLTPDDKTNEGKTKTDRFPARKPVIDFCYMLKDNRELNDIKKLPSVTDSTYTININLHNDINIRDLYYKNISDFGDQVIFIDPDNGFEPEKSCTQKHVSYEKIGKILDQISDNSIISVFHHFRRITFAEDFKGIKKRILEASPSAYVNAIYWHQLMFVLISKTKERNKKIILANNHYSKSKNQVIYKTPTISDNNLIFLIPNPLN